MRPSKPKTLFVVLTHVGLTERLVRRKGPKERLRGHGGIQSLRYIPKSLLTVATRHKLIVRAKKNHLRENILNKKLNSKELYKVVNGFLKPSIGSQCLPSNHNTEALTEKFACYFTEKISKIRVELDIMETVTPSVKEMSARIGNNGLDSFEPVTETEVNKILKNLSKKTCSFDVVPTWLIIECADSLTPAITSIVNCSLESGEMPVDLKKAIVKPLLKRLT